MEKAALPYITGGKPENIITKELAMKTMSNTQAMNRENGMNDMEAVKAGHKGLSITDILYHDILWTVFYLFNILYALGRIMVRFNGSPASDGNPISVALHAGFYLICVIAVGTLCLSTGTKFARCSAMEILYFGLRIIVLTPQFSETFSYLLAARVICILGGAFMGFVLFKKQYKEMDKEYHFRWKIILPVAVFSIVLFIIVYHEYVKQMIGGTFILAIIAVCCGLGGGGNVIPIEDIDSIILKK